MGIGHLLLVNESDEPIGLDEVRPLFISVSEMAELPAGSNLLGSVSLNSPATGGTAKVRIQNTISKTPAKSAAGVLYGISWNYPFSKVAGLVSGNPTPLATMFVDRSKLWTPDLYAAYWVLMESGTYSLKCRLISGNRQNALSFATIGGAPSSADKYLINYPVPASRQGTLTGTPSTTVLEDTAKTWTVNEHIGRYVLIISGTYSGTAAYILSNTTNTLTLGGTGLPNAPAPGDEYQIAPIPNEGSGEVTLYDGSSVVAVLEVPRGSSNGIIIPNGISFSTTISVQNSDTDLDVAVFYK